MDVRKLQVIYLTLRLNRFIVELYNIKFDDKRVNVDVKQLKNRPLF
jgi:hypothetical protein